MMYGGFIGAIVAGILYFKIKKIPFLPYADVSAPSVGIGIFLTRIGCFLNGCCYGASNTGSLGVSFPLESPAGVYQQHIHASGLHASQLYESAGGLLIAISPFQKKVLHRVPITLKFSTRFSALSDFSYYGTDEKDL